MKVSGILFPRGRACGDTQFGQLRSGVQARLYLFRESVDGFRSSGSFGCQSDRKPSGPGLAIPVGGDRLDDDGNFHGMPLVLDPTPNPFILHRR